MEYDGGWIGEIILASLAIPLSGTVWLWMVWPGQASGRWALAKMSNVTSYQCDDNDRNTNKNMGVARSDIFLSPNLWTALGDTSSAALTVPFSYVPAMEG